MSCQLCTITCFQSFCDSSWVAAMSWKRSDWQSWRQDSWSQGWSQRSQDWSQHWGQQSWAKTGAKAGLMMTEASRTSTKAGWMTGGWQAAVRIRPPKNKRKTNRAKQVQNYERRCLRLMWQQARETRESGESFDVVSWAQTNLSWASYVHARETKGFAESSSVPSLEQTEVEQVRQTVIWM